MAVQSILAMVMTKFIDIGITTRMTNCFSTTSHGGRVEGNGVRVSVMADMG